MKRTRDPLLWLLDAGLAVCLTGAVFFLLPRMAVPEPEVARIAIEPDIAVVRFPPPPEIRPEESVAEPELRDPRPLEAPPVDQVELMEEQVSLPPALATAAPVLPEGFSLPKFGVEGIAATPAVFSEPEAGGTGTPPKVISQGWPRYPAAARFRGVEGYVDVRVAVRADGSVDGVEVMEASPPGIFDRAAVAAAQKWTFAPATRNGAAVPGEIRQRIIFTLPE